MEISRVRLLVDFNIHNGELEEFHRIAQQMLAVSEQEPGTLGYHFVLSADRETCRLVEGYADAAAITAHFHDTAVQQFVPQMLRFASPTRMEIYGDPGPQVATMAVTFRRTDLYVVSWLRPLKPRISQVDYHAGLPSLNRSVSMSSPLSTSRAKISSAPSCVILEPVTSTLSSGLKVVPI